MPHSNSNKNADKLRNKTVEEKLEELEINKAFLFQALHQLQTLKKELEQMKQDTETKIRKRSAELEEKAGELQWQLEVLKEKKSLKDQKRSDQNGLSNK